MPEIQTNNPEHALLPAITAALATVNDPEIRKPVTDLGMVERVDIDEAGAVFVKILLTISGCPLKGPIQRAVTAVVVTASECSMPTSTAIRSP